MYQVSVSVWAGIVGDVTVGLCLSLKSLATQQHRDFLGRVLLGLLEDGLQAVSRGCGFSTTVLSFTKGKMSCSG